MRIDKVRWLTAHNCVQPKLHSFTSSLKLKRGQFCVLILSHNICHRKQTTEPKFVILVSFFSEDISYTDISYWIRIVSGQLPRRTIPQRTGFGPSGELSWWGIVLGIVVLVDNGWALFFIWWGIVLMGNCPKKPIRISWEVCRSVFFSWATLYSTKSKETRLRSIIFL